MRKDTIQAVLAHAVGADATKDELREQVGLTASALFERLTKGKMVPAGSLNERNVAERFAATRDRLRAYQGQLFEFDGGKGHYVAVPDVQGLLRRFVEALYDEQVEYVRALPECKGYEDQIRPRGIKGSWLHDVEASLHAAVNIPVTTQVPCWLAVEEEAHYDPWGQWQVYTRPLIAPEKQFIAAANTLIDVDVYVETGRVEEPDADPREWFSLHRMPHRYVKGAKAPKWTAFLNRVLEQDKERIALLQEFFGYLLTSDTRFHKFLLLEGEGSNGKSVVVNVMAGLLGHEAVSSIPLSSFAARFDKFFTFGKALNVCSEASELTARLEDHLKAYVGGDLISTDRKHREVFQFRPTAKLVVTTNNRPKVADESMGFWRRMLLLPFRVSISQSEQNPRLADELLEAEGEGILLWALEGLRRLRRNNQFTIPKLSQEEQAVYRRESNPVMQFVEEFLTQDEAATVECGEVYKAYTRWAQLKGEKPLNDALFGKSLRRAVPGLDTVQHRKDGMRVRSYVGITLGESNEAARKNNLPLRKSA